MKKRLFSLAMALVLACGLAVTPAFAASEGLDNFRKVNTYSEQFTDVARDAWYHDSVAAAYEYGLMQGSGDAFNPNGTVTVAEALAMAARLRDIYYGGDGKFTQGNPWYQVYVDYALTNNLIGERQFSDYGAKAARKEFADILASAFPYSALRVINHVTALPDVKCTDYYAPAIYLLYNAGILTGGDAQGTFNPESTITRAEVAAIVVRMADSASRKTLAFGTQMTALEFLTYLAKTLGTVKQYSDGSEYNRVLLNTYTGLFHAGNGRAYESELYLDLEPNGNVSVVMWDGLPDQAGNSYLMQYLNWIMINKSLSGQYSGRASMQDSDGVVSAGSLSVDAAYITENCTVSLTDYEGDPNQKEALESGYVGTIISTALRLLEADYLIPYGYTLADLGFLSMVSMD